MKSWAAIVGSSIFLSLFLCARSAPAYVEAPYTLGKIIAESSNVLVITVTAVDKQKNTIIYRKIRDIKGNHPGDTVKHFIGQNGFHPREWQNVMAWAEVGKTAVFFHNGGAGEVCVDNYWYQIYAGDWWNMSHAEPYMLRSYAGKPEKLATAVTAMLAGQEVVVPCMVDSDKNGLHLRNARLQRMKASLKDLDYNAKRDFVDWGAGGDEFRAVAGMPGFTHLLSLSRVSPGAAGVSVADINGDGRPDLLLFGASRLSLSQNGGNAFDEVRLPVDVGARAAAWADYDGDGKPDLLLATPAGAKLFRFDGKEWSDVSGALPDQGYANVTAAAWIDYDGDGRPDILLADGFRGLRLYRNCGVSPGPPPQPKIGKWYYAGPFDSPDRRGFDIAYPPEREVELGQQYLGKGNEPVVWREGKFKDGQVNDLRLFKPEHNNACVVYLYREFDFGGSVEMPVGLGSDDTLTVWLNGVKVHAENVSRACKPDEVQLKLRLRPGKNALLLKICNGDGDFAFYFAAKFPAAVVPQVFEDVSDVVKLGTASVGGNLKGDHLAVADVNGDNRPDFLFSAGNGLLVLNTPQGFVEAKDCGLSYRAGGVTPAFGDFNGDGRPDLIVPQRGGCRLFRNEGGGRFADVTGSAGDLARPIGDARCAAWAAFKKGGPPDLFVGCWRGPNRYFRNNGNGTFTDATEDVGLMHRIFNTVGVAVLDANNDGVPDVVFNNEGQDPVLLLASSSGFSPPQPAKTADTAAPGVLVAKTVESNEAPNVRFASLAPEPQRQDGQPANSVAEAGRPPAAETDAHAATGEAGDPDRAADTPSRTTPVVADLTGTGLSAGRPGSGATLPLTLLGTFVMIVVVGVVRHRTRRRSES